MSRIRLVLLVVVLITISSVAVVQAQVMNGAGSFQLTLAGYQLQGRLTNSTLFHNNTVAMSMGVDYADRTNIGQVSITSKGNWYGMANGTNLEGVIYGVNGIVQVCYVFYCANANYVGYGTWGGTLSSDRSEAQGTFQGIVVFTNSQITGITLNKPVQMSGTWNSTLQSSS